MVDYIPKMVASGVTSFKIEGRAKSHYYTAVTANAYRGAMDAFLKDPTGYTTPEWVKEELNKISHRNYSTGFYLGKPENSQTYANAGYVRDYSVAAVVEGYEDGMIKARVKNKFLLGQEFDCLEPRAIPFKFTVEKIIDEKGESVDSAPRPMSLVSVPCDRPVKVGSLLRMKT